MKDIKKYFLDSQIIVHAGGLGERWWPVTRGKIPKPRTEIGKKPRPMFDWVILPYVASGCKEFFVSLWHNPQPLIDHCKKINNNTGIKFNFLVEPEKKRLGRAGCIKYGIENGILNEKKPILSINASDIVRINPFELTRYHLESVKMGFYATVVGAKTLPTEFGIFRVDKNQKIVRFEEKPVISLDGCFGINTGIIFLHSSANKILMRLEEDKLPLNLEDVDKSKIIKKIWNKTRNYPYAEPFKNWVFCKSPKDFKRVNGMDIEKFLKISSCEKFFGKF